MLDLGEWIIDRRRSSFLSQFFVHFFFVYLFLLPFPRFIPRVLHFNKILISPQDTFREFFDVFNRELDIASGENFDFFREKQVSKILK